MTRFLIAFIFPFITLFSFTQENATLSGYLTDGSSGESLIGAKVFIPSLKKGTVSNTYGFYSLTVPIGTYTVEFRATGLPTETKVIELTKDIRYDVEMGANLQTLKKLL